MGKEKREYVPPRIVATEVDEMEANASDCKDCSCKDCNCTCRKCTSGSIHILPWKFWR